MSVPETFTYTGTQLAQQVKDKFGDTGQVQITDAMLLAWINNGQRQIVAETTLIETVLSMNLVGGTGVYDIGTLFTGGRVQSYKQITVNGIPIKMLTFDEYQGYIASNAIDAERADYPAVGMLYGSTLNLWPVPNKTLTTGIKFYVGTFPLDLVALANPLTVPDRLFNPLSDYVLAQALELDENYEAAARKVQQFETGMQKEFARANRSPQASYPSMTPDPYDSDTGYISSMDGTLP